MRTTIQKILAAAVALLLACTSLVAQQVSNHGPFENDYPGSSDRGYKNAFQFTFKDGSKGNPYVSGVTVKDRDGTVIREPSEGTGPDGKPGADQYVIRVLDDGTTQIRFGTDVAPGESVCIELTRDAGSATPVPTPTGGYKGDGFVIAE